MWYTFRKILLFAFYLVVEFILFKIVDSILHISYVFDAVKLIFIREYPHYGEEIYFFAVTLPHWSIFIITAFLINHALKKYIVPLLPTDYMSKIAHKIEYKIITVSPNDSYDKVLISRFVYFLVYTVIFIGLYYLLWILGISEKSRFYWQTVMGRIFVVLLLSYLIWFIVGNTAWTINRLRHFLFAPGNAYNLAITRIIMFIFVLGLYRNALVNSTFWMDMTPEAIVPLPYTAWFIYYIPVSHDIYVGFAWAGIVLSVLAILGFCTRWVLFLNIFVVMYVLGMPMFFGKLFHMHIWVWFPAIMAFSRCADVLSIDSIIRRKRGLPDPYAVNDAVYGIPVKFIMLHFGIIYFFAGIIKLWDCGFDWALSHSVINQMQVEWIQHYNEIPAIRIDRFPVLVKLGSVLVIVFEICFLFLVISRKFRWMAFVMALLFHNLVGYFMYIDFFDLQLSYFFIINWIWVWAFVSRKPILPIEPRRVLWRNDKNYKNILVFGTLLFIVNFICGLTRTHSWPFSSYPTYSSLVKDTHNYIYFDVATDHGEKIDVDGMGKMKKFRKESYTPIEDRIYENVLSGDSVTMRKNITKLWKIWQSGVPELKDVRQVDVWLRESPVNPDESHRLLKNEYLLTFTPKDL